VRIAKLLQEDLRSIDRDIRSLSAAGVDAGATTIVNEC
jgi:predicted DNA-binding transcriptional regulator YafY